MDHRGVDRDEFTPGARDPAAVSAEAETKRLVGSVGRTGAPGPTMSYGAFSVFIDFMAYERFRAFEARRTSRPKGTTGA